MAEAKVRDLHLAVGIEQNVAGLHVAVNLMRIVAGYVLTSRRRTIGMTKNSRDVAMRRSPLAHLVPLAVQVVKS